MDFLLLPPVAFLLYGAILYALGRALGGRTRRTALYAGGEIHPTGRHMLGYRRFFVFALFFAVVHMGVLMLASGTPSPAMLVYLAGIVLSLIALLLG